MVSSLVFAGLGLFAQSTLLPQWVEGCNLLRVALLRQPSPEHSQGEWKLRRSETLIVATGANGSEFLFEADGSGLREAKLGAFRSPEPKAEPKLAEVARRATRFMDQIGQPGGESSSALSLRESAATQWFSLRQILFGYPTAHVHQFQYSSITGDLLSYSGPSRFRCTKPGRVLTRREAFDRLRAITTEEKPGTVWRDDLINGPMWSQVNREMRWDKVRLPAKTFVDADLKDRILEGEAILVYLVELMNAKNRREICYGYVDATSGQVIVANWTNRTIRP